MKLIGTKSIKVYLLLPTCGKYTEESAFFRRRGSKLQMDSGFTYLNASEDVGNWLGFSILGFGLGFYWNFTEEIW
jgi:hypothetical protein